ncbi:helix-turn-helix domain-containing protein [Acidovorax sp. sif1233]|uniref:helix-turn-helix domain-containing protein n=1 Tax=Acidovorax sp. sif1233 TaxID=2854792 RepID=UPI002103AAD3|nr:helix-turn-helix domain-containing protein [Acidovorax sp. sif1233]
MPVRTTVLSSCVNVGILWGRDSIASTATAVVDALRAMNMLAAMRPGGAQPALRWFWLPMPHEGDATPPPVPAGGDGSQGPLHVVVIPGWLVPTGPQLREVSSRYSQHFGAMLHSHLRGGGRALALFNGSSLLAHCGLLAGRKAALPWVFAPSIVLQSSESGPAAADGAPPADVVWQREQAWQRDGALWTTASLQDTLPAVLDLLGHTPAAELAQAAMHALLFDRERQLTATAAMETPTGHPLAAGALELARRWLQAHRNEPYSLQATARAAATSPRTLLRWFAQVHGESPQDYLHRLRIAQAQALLQTTYLTVEDVAQQCGYSDTGSFRKVFARVCGVTPGAYRQRFKLRTSRKQWLARQTPPGADSAGEA